MIDFSAILKTIEEYIEANFNTVPIQFENSRLNVADPKEYIASSSITGDATPPAMGSTTSLVTGAVVFQIFTELGSGAGRATSIGSELATLLIGINVNGLSFQAPILNPIGQTEEANYYQHNLTIQYEFIYG